MKQAYLCKPKKETRSASVVCISLLAVAALSFFFASFLPSLRGFGQFLAAVALLVFIQITTKFLLSEYEYVFEDGNLSLSFRQGRKIKNFGSVSINSRTHLLKEEEWKQRKAEFLLQNRFSLCQNLFPRNAYVLLCPGEKGFLYLRFEPDEKLVLFIQNKIDEEKSKED